MTVDQAEVLDLPVSCFTLKNDNSCVPYVTHAYAYYDLNYYLYTVLCAEFTDCTAWSGTECYA